MRPPVLKVEREKSVLLLSLQESQTQLQHTQGALSEQHERMHRLTQHVNGLRRCHGDDKNADEQESEKPDGSPSPPGRHDDNEVADMDIHGFEILECKYKVAVTEVIDLKAELKALKEKYNQCVEGQGEELSAVQALNEQVICLERSSREGRDKLASLEAELRAATGMAGETQAMLNTAQDELVTFSEELAQLYHHVCLCNNETPNRVMLDYYRQGRGPRAGLGGPKGAAADDDSRVLLTPRLARRLAAVVAATGSSGESRSPSESPSKEGGREGGKTPPTGSPSISASSSSSSSSSPALESAGDPRREPMNIYYLNAIIKEQE